MIVIVSPCLSGNSRATTAFKGVFITPYAVLFIDSSNFYHSLKEQNELPFDAEEFFDLVQELKKYFDVKEIKFYDAIKDRTIDPAGYAGQQRFHSRLMEKIHDIEIRHLKLRYVLTISKEKTSEIAKEVGLPNELLDKLYLFLKKLGVVKLSREKGLDVLMVVDALETFKKDKNMSLIFLTGDSDFVPAVKFIREEDGKVINLHMFSGSSRELRKACSEHMLIEIDTSGKVSIKRYKTLS